MWAAWGSFTASGLREGQHAYVTSSVELLMADRDAYFAFVLVIDPLLLSSDFVGEPWGSFAWGGSKNSMVGNKLYISDHRYTPPSGGAAADEQVFETRLLTAYNFQLSIPLPNHGVAGNTGFGAVDIDNADEGVDSWTERAWEGRIGDWYVGGTFNKGKAGETTLTWSEYGKVVSLVCAGVDWDEKTISPAFADLSLELDKTFPPNTYGGTGTTDGNAQIQGQVKPLIYGTVTNYEPRKIADNVYQVTDGVINSLDAVRVNGTAQSNAGATSDPFTESVSAGEYKHQLATGLIYVEDDGDVRVDVAQTELDAFEIIRDIIAGYAGVVDPDEIKLTGLPTSYNIGVVFNAEGTVRDAVNKICEGMGWFWFFDRNGLFTVAEWVDPRSTAVLATVEETDIELLSLKRGPSPRTVWKHRIGYARNWNPQEPSSQDSGVSEANRAAYAAEYKFVEDTDTNAKSRFRRSQEVETLSLLTNKADAVTLVASWISRDGHRFSVYGATVSRWFMQFTVGKVIVLDTTKFNLANKPGMLLAISESSDDFKTHIKFLVVDE